MNIDIEVTINLLIYMMISEMLDQQLLWGVTIVNIDVHLKLKFKHVFCFNTRLTFAFLNGISRFIP